MHHEAPHFPPGRQSHPQESSITSSGSLSSSPPPLPPPVTPPPPPPFAPACPQPPAAPPAALSETVFDTGSPFPPCAAAERSTHRQRTPLAAIQHHPGAWHNTHLPARLGALLHPPQPRRRPRPPGRRRLERLQEGDHLRRRRRGAADARGGAVLARARQEAPRDGILRVPTTEQKHMRSRRCLCRILVHRDIAKRTTTAGTTGAPGSRRWCSPPPRRRAPGAGATAAARGARRGTSRTGRRRSPPRRRRGAAPGARGAGRGQERTRHGCAGAQRRRVAGSAPACARRGGAGRTEGSTSVSASAARALSALVAARSAIASEKPETAAARSSTASSATKSGRFSGGHADRENRPQHAAVRGASAGTGAVRCGRWMGKRAWAGARPRTVQEADDGRRGQPRPGHHGLRVRVLGRRPPEVRQERRRAVPRRGVAPRLFGEALIVQDLPEGVEDRQLLVAGEVPAAGAGAGAGRGGRGGALLAPLGGFLQRAVPSTGLGSGGQV